jgi:hypothetical protein
MEHWDTRRFQRWLWEGGSGADARRVRSISLEAVPNIDGIDQFVNLEAFECTNTAYLSVPQSITTLQSLTHLSLRQNHEMRLPETLGLIRNLRYLDLRSNGLRRIPEGIHQLRRLEALLLTGNNLARIPSTIADMVWLRVITVDEENLTPALRVFVDARRPPALRAAERDPQGMPMYRTGEQNLERGIEQLFDNHPRRANYRIAPEPVIMPEPNDEPNDEPNNGIEQRLARMMALRNANNIRFAAMHNPPRLPTAPEGPVAEHVVQAPPFHAQRFHAPLLRRPIDAPLLRRPIDAPLLRRPIAGFAFQVHNAFDRVNKARLTAYIERSLGTIPIISADNDEFLRFADETMRRFIESLSGSERQTAMREYQTIYDRCLQLIAYTPEYRKLITYALEFTRRQPREFQQTYVKNFAHDNTHAYNSSAPLTCAKGAMERFVMLLVPSAMLYRESPSDWARYEELVRIIEVPTTLRGVLDMYAGDCFRDSDGDVSRFRDCMMLRVLEVLGEEYEGRPTREVAEEAIREYAQELGVFGGGYRRRQAARRKATRRQATRRKATRRQATRRQATRRQATRGRQATRRQATRRQAEGRQAEGRQAEGRKASLRV